MNDASSEEDEQAAQVRRESVALFREMADGLPHMVWMHDAAGQQEMVNATFCEFFGVTREEMKGGRWQALMHPADAEAYRREFAKCVETRQPFHGEVRVRRADGQWRCIESWGRPRFTASGTFRGFIGTSVDVTERKRAEAALERSQRTVADAMPQLVWTARRDGTVEYYNSRAVHYGGIEQGTDGSWEWRPVVHPDDRPATIATWRAAVESGQTYEIEHRVQMADGSYRWHLSRAYLGSDEPRRWFGTATDVHALKEAQEALREADRRKDEFLAMLGHELRNPLAALRTATELLQHADIEDPLVTRVQGVLDRQTGQMARLVDGLLEVSRITRGKIALDPRPLDLRGVIERVLEDRREAMSRAGLELGVHLPTDAVWVRADEVRLVQIFDNLLANALKFTERGTVEVQLERRGAYAQVTLTDTGVGIETHLLSRIFEPFRQGTTDLARTSGGLGLGLALSKGLVELHGGTIVAHSAGPGEGASFVLRFPLTDAPAAATERGLAVQGDPQRILIVEDNVDTARMLRELLERKGHEVTAVESGAEALASLRRRPPDVVLCDIGLPGMDGLELARAVRADPALTEVRLIALTGYGQADDRRRSEAAGFDDHLTKPVDLQSLEEMLDRSR